MQPTLLKKELQIIMEEYKKNTLPFALDISQTSLLKELFEEMRSHPGITPKQKKDYMFLYLDIVGQIENYQTLINTNPKP